MRISDWSSYVCSSDLLRVAHADLRDQGCDRITTLDDELQQPLAFAFACRRKISERRREQLARLGQQRREVGLHFLDDARVREHAPRLGHPARTELGSVGIAVILYLLHTTANKSDRIAPDL